jgi:hypothetical protein
MAPGVPEVGVAVVAIVGRADVGHLPLAHADVPAPYGAGDDVDVAIIVHVAEDGDDAGAGAGEQLAGVQALAGGAVEDGGGGDDLGETIIVEVVDRGAVPADLVDDAGVEGGPEGRILGAVPLECDDAGAGAVGDDLRGAVAVEVADGRRGGADHLVVRVVDRLELAAGAGVEDADDAEVIGVGAVAGLGAAVAEVVGDDDELGAIHAEVGQGRGERGGQDVAVIEVGVVGRRGGPLALHVGLEQADRDQALAVLVGVALGLGAEVDAGARHLAVGQAILAATIGVPVAILVADAVAVEGDAGAGGADLAFGTVGGFGAGVAGVAGGAAARVGGGAGAGVGGGGGDGGGGAVGGGLRRRWWTGWCRWYRW